MGKFSDSSYNILKTYFDILQTPRTGTDNSFITGPKITIFAEGSLDTTLYQRNENDDFIAHKFLIQEVDGNNFKFQYRGRISKHSVATELELGSEMYFRKDSLFHDWLKNNASLYEQAINTNKTFIYFGKIYPVSGENTNYNVIFDGMKDYVVNALPEHNRTDNIVEFLKILFDEVYHDTYNMTKTLFSFFDAREVNIDHLDYLATRANISTNVDKIDTELLLREFVQALPYWLKRKGTYTAYYIVYRLLTGHTRNKLNIYERWAEWCLNQARLDNPLRESDWKDHHIIEAYGQQPSGGSGMEYYSQYDPDKYPVYASTAPTGSCVDPSYQCSTRALYTDFSYVDEGNYVTDISPATIMIDNYDQTAGNKMYFHKLPAASATDHIAHCMTVSMPATATPSGGAFIWAASRYPNHTIDEHELNNKDYLGVSFDYVGKRTTTDIVAAFNAWTNDSFESFNASGFTINLASNTLGFGQATGTTVVPIALDPEVHELNVNYTLTIQAADGGPSGAVFMTFFDDDGDVTNTLEITPGTNSRTLTFIPTRYSSDISVRILTGNKVSLIPLVINHMWKSDTSLYRRRFKLWENYSSTLTATESSATYSPDHNYYLTIEKVPSASEALPDGVPAQLRLRTYRCSRKIDTNRIETVKLNLQNNPQPSSLYGLNSKTFPTSATWSADISDFFEDFDRDPFSIGPTGYNVLTPHYKVEIDLSSEPFGVDYILNEDTVDELLRYWTYIKPVSKFAHYHELISPVGKIDELSEAVSLYRKSETAVCDTRFVGADSLIVSAANISAAPPVSGDNYYLTSVHVQPTAILTWNFEHNLSSHDVIVQVFDKDDICIYPAQINNLEAVRSRIVWTPARRGRAFAAAAKPWNYTLTVSAAASAWNMPHNMGTDISATGVVAQFFDYDYSADIIPETVQIVDDDTLKATFSEAVSGRSVIRDADYRHVQNTATTTWNVNHNLNVRGVIVSFYDHNRYQIYPSEITILDYNRVRATFSEAVSGEANIIIFERQFTEIDVRDLLRNGYWKLGNGGTDDFDPVIRNDLSNVTTSGAIISLRETIPSVSGSYLVDFSVPTGRAYTVNEMGLFDENKNMQFYTRLNDLHKPAEMQLDVKYRINKV